VEASGDVPASLAASVAAWVQGWGEEVAAVDLTTARRRFAGDVVAFGTHADVVAGVDALAEEQWGRIWPAIEDFRFELEALHVIASPDGLQAVAVVPWSSTGIDEQGGRFDRPGRATIVLSRRSASDPWQGVHSHFSLARGVPSSTHGTRPAR
jgi:ketosteroid isomerase-like protein